MEIPEAKKKQWKTMGETQENTGMAADESQKQKRGDRGSKERRQNSSLRVINGSLSPHECGVGTKITKKKKTKQSRAPC